MCVRHCVYRRVKIGLGPLWQAGGANGATRCVLEITNLWQNGNSPGLEQILGIYTRQLWWGWVGGGGGDSAVLYNPLQAWTSPLLGKRHKVFTVLKFCGLQKSVPWWVAGAWYSMSPLRERVSGSLYYFHNIWLAGLFGIHVPSVVGKQGQEG